MATAGLIHSVLFLVDLFGSLLTEIGNGVVYVLVRNYELVSCLLWLLMQCLTAIHRIIVGFYLVVSDFVDQYGDFCVIIIESIWAFLASLVNSVLYSIQLITKFLTVLANGVKWMVECPVTAFNTALAAIGAVQAVPGQLLDTTVVGFSLLGVLFVDCAVWLVGCAGFVFKLGFDSVVAVLGGMVRVCRRDAVKTALLDKTITRVTVEAAIGMTVCALCYLIYKQNPAWFRLIQMKLLLVMYRLSGMWLSMQATVSLWSRVLIQWLRGRQRPINRPTRRPLGRLPLNAHANDATVGLAKGPSEDMERYLCVVCQDKEKTVMVDYCNHVCMCKDCAESVLRRQGRCPICRSLIIRLVDVYL